MKYKVAKSEFEVKQTWKIISFTFLNWVFTNWEKTIWYDLKNSTDKIFLKDLSKRRKLNLKFN